MTDTREELDRRELARLNNKDTRRRNDRILLLGILAVGFIGYGVMRGEVVALILGAALAVWTVIAFRNR